MLTTTFVFGGEQICNWMEKFCYCETQLLGFDQKASMDEIMATLSQHKQKFNQLSNIIIIYIEKCGLFYEMIFISLSNMISGKICLRTSNYY